KLPHINEQIENKNIPNTDDTQARAQVTSPASPTTRLDVSRTTLSHNAEIKSSNNILLATAQVYAHCDNGERKVVRCLIDNGSQNNLITTDCCKLLNIPIIPLSNSFIKGVGLTSRPVHGYVYLDIESRVSPNKYHIHALVVDRITDQLPANFINSSDLHHISKLPLADSNWNVPGGIDLVIGVQLSPYIYLGNRLDIGTHGPIAVESTLGVILLGDVRYDGTSNDVRYSGTSDDVRYSGTSDNVRYSGRSENVRYSGTSFVINNNNSSL
ncbi:hypothetical protein Cfor_00633, partial [Coptotermes formosanus]